MNWKIYKKTFNLNREGFGIATYEVATPSRFYTLICFSHYLSPENRTDRVIANQWDATFVLFDGVPNKSDIERLSKMALADPSTGGNPKKLSLNDMRTMYQHSMSGVLF